MVIQYKIIQYHICLIENETRVFIGFADILFGNYESLCFEALQKTMFEFVAQIEIGLGV
jgi:hypothetical protein